MVERLPPEVEAKYTKYLKLRETLNSVEVQKSRVELELAEVTKVKEEVERLPDDAEIFVLKGFVLVKKSKEEVLKELSKQKEDLEVKLLSLKSHEESLRKEVERLERELKSLLSGLGGAQAGGRAG